MGNRSAHFTEHLTTLVDALDGVQLTAEERAALDAVAEAVDCDTAAGLALLFERLMRGRRQASTVVASLENEVRGWQRTYEKLNAQVAALGDQLDGERAAREAMLAALEDNHRAAVDMERRRGDHFTQGMAAGALASLEAARHAVQGVDR